LDLIGSAFMKALLSPQKITPLIQVFGIMTPQR
jgi:hypothetical protein